MAAADAAIGYPERSAAASPRDGYGASSASGEISAASVDGSSSSTSGRRWYCYCCGRYTPPVIGFIFDGAQHRCRKCNRTVCGHCSTVPRGGQRTCQACYLAAGDTKALHREKYIFLVRHAQSTWNQNVDLVKTLPHMSFQTTSFTDVVSRAAHLMAKGDLWHRDHPVSWEGVRQTGDLRRKIAESRQCETEREQRYYDSFLSRRKQIYCSPLLRALQTAHLALPEEGGWGSIKLLKDARERFSFVFERDCLGTGVGAHILDRAMQMGQDLGQELPDIRQRVDATDCSEKWWSDEPETEADLEVRLTSLWRRLLEEDHDDSCVLVTHSNLIKALLMRFGGVGEEGQEERGRSKPSNDNDNNQGLPRAVGGLGVGHVPDDEQLQSPTSSPKVVPLARHRTAPASLDAMAVDGFSTASGSSDSEEPLSEESDDLFASAGEDLSGEAVGQRSSLLSRWRRRRRRRRTSCWQVVDGGPEMLRRLKVERLQNCGVLGLRCVLESPAPRPSAEVDGWIDVDAEVSAEAEACDSTSRRSIEQRWVAKDALLMFDSLLVK